MAKKKKRRSAGSLVLTLLIIVFSGVLIYSAVNLGQIWLKYHHNTVSQGRVSDLFYGQTGDGTGATAGATAEAVDGTGVSAGAVTGDAATGTSLGQNTLTGAISLGPLVSQNPDTVGWINIPDTVVDYSVMQAEDNDYYLHRDFFGEYNFNGMIFMDYRNTIGGKWQNYIMYGHRMSDKTMFYIIGKYLEQDWYEDHKTFTVLMRVGDEDILYDCKVFSAYRLTTSLDVWVPYFADVNEYEKYIREETERSMIQCDVTASRDDQILTLSTCDYELSQTEGRLLVHAIMIPRVVTPVDAKPVGQPQ